MAQARQILTRRKTVRNICKITRTMERIATSRYKRVQARVVGVRGYANLLSHMVSNLAGASNSPGHPLLEAHRDAPTEAVIVLASNRGMCGGYNGAVNRQAEQLCAGLLEAGRAVEVHLFGKKASARLEHERLVIRGRHPLQETVPTIEDASAIADGFMDRYLLGELSGVQVVYVQFLSAGAQRPAVLRLLPAGHDEPWPDSLVRRRRIAPILGEDRYDLLPDPQTVYRRLVPLSVRVRLHQCLLDAQAGEHVARMTAMRLATENADRMIRTLTTQYNRARQSAITTEIAEIMGGAEAME